MHWREELSRRVKPIGVSWLATNALGTATKVAPKCTRSFLGKTRLSMIPYGNNVAKVGTYVTFKSQDMRDILAGCLFGNWA